MAETLGSLVDKISIKNLRVWHIQEEIDAGKTDLQPKLDIVQNQRQDLADEIDEYVALAMAGKIKAMSDEKVKLYNDDEIKGKTGHLKDIGAAVDALAMKNTEVWHLEDMARVKDAPDSAIADVKRKIDVANQQRNDCMDRIDTLFKASLAAR